MGMRACMYLLLFLLPLDIGLAVGTSFLILLLLPLGSLDDTALLLATVRGDAPALELFHIDVARRAAKRQHS